MKRVFILFGFLLAACAPVLSTPEITETATPIFNQYPTLMPTPTLAIITKPIAEADKEKAYNFFYEMKNKMALKNYDHFAEEIRYPITVKVNGQPKTIVYAAEFDANFQKIFSQEQIQKFISTDESELTFTPDGVKVADGMVWFDLICLDPDCGDAEFMLTEINN